MRMKITKGSPMKEVLSKKEYTYESGDTIVSSTPLTMKKLGELSDEGLLLTDDSVVYSLNHSSPKLAYNTNAELVHTTRFIVSINSVRKYLKDENVPKDMSGSVFSIYLRDNEEEYDRLLALLVSS